MSPDLWIRNASATHGVLRNLTVARHGACISGLGVTCAAQVAAVGAEGVRLRLGAGLKPLLPVVIGSTVRVDIVTAVRKLHFMAAIVDAHPGEWTVSWPVAVQTEELREGRRWSAFQLAQVRFMRGSLQSRPLAVENLSATGLMIKGPTSDLQLRLEDRLEGWLVWPKRPPTAVGGLVRSVSLVGAATMLIGSEFFMQSMLDEASLRLALGV